MTKQYYFHFFDSAKQVNDTFCIKCEDEATALIIFKACYPKSKFVHMSII